MRGITWLGSERGYLSDWITQLWVQLTGRKINLSKHPWLDGPTASTSGITGDYFDDLAARQGLKVRSHDGAGIISNFATLQGSTFDPAKVDSRVSRFYEETSAYDLDAWAEWCGVFRPLGWLLAVIFSRRLQQLNIPLSGLDTSRGVTNEVLRFVHPTTGESMLTAWYRRLPETGNVLYAGFYSVSPLPGRGDPCVKVVFPLPNGNAIVIMWTDCRPDGSFVVTSAGDRFGDPGFYFTVHTGRDTARVRYVRALQENIHVYPAESGLLRADHVLTYFGVTFLRLHYRMQRK